MKFDIKLKKPSEAPYFFMCMKTGAVDGMYPKKPLEWQEMIDHFNNQYPGTYWILAQAHTTLFPNSFSDEIGINWNHPLSTRKRTSN